MPASTVAILTLATLLASEGNSPPTSSPVLSPPVKVNLQTSPVTDRSVSSVLDVSPPEMWVALASEPVTTTLNRQDIAELRQLIADTTGESLGKGDRIQALDYSITLINALIVILCMFPLATVLLFFIVRRLIVKDFVGEVKKQLNKMGELENYLDNYSQRAHELVENLQKEVNQHKHKLNEDFQAVANRAELARRYIEQMESVKTQFLMHLQVMVSEAQSEKEKIFQEIHKIKPSLMLDSGVGIQLAAQTLTKEATPPPQVNSVSAVPLSPENSNPAITAQDYLKQGEIFQREQRYPEAIAACQKALQLQPNFYEAWFALGCLYNLVQCYPEALAAYDKAIEINPQKYETWYNRGNTLGRLHRYQEAIASFDQGIALNPERYEVWYNRGSILRKLERYREAIACYDKAIELNPNRGESWYNRGNALATIGDYEEAVRSYDQALEIDAHKPEAWFNRGTALEHLQRYQEALVCLDKVLELGEKDTEVLYKRGTILEKLACYEDAIAAYDQALMLQPNHAKAWSGKGVAFEGLKRYEEALLAYTKSLEIQPNNPEIWRSKGGVLAELQRYKEAVISFGTALRVQDHVLPHSEGSDNESEANSLPSSIKN